MTRPEEGTPLGEDVLSPSRADGGRPQDDGLLEEIRELPDELAGAAEAIRKDMEATRAGRWAIGAYLWLENHTPRTSRGRLVAALLVFLVALAPSLALFYLTFAEEVDLTENWFGRLGYAGIFLANLLGSATLFVPVPGLTAAGQALIVSSSQSLNPFWVGTLGGLGMAMGEITAYAAGMATAAIVREEEINATGRLRRLLNRMGAGVTWLMSRYGALTLFTLSVIPNPFFEVAGWSAGATRFPFWGFIAAVTAGKVTRGLALAYVGERIFFG